MSTLLTALLLAQLATPPPPQCDAEVGPPACAQPGWTCFSPERRGALAQYVAACEADRDRHQVEIGALAAEHETVLRAERGRHRVEGEAWQARHAALVDRHAQMEAALARSEHGHPTWVLVVSAVGSALVAGGVVGL